MSGMRERFVRRSVGPRCGLLPRSSSPRLQALHRLRSRLIGSRTQLGNQIRGLLAEYGTSLLLHLSEVRKRLPELFLEDRPLLTSFSRELFASLYEQSALDPGHGTTDPTGVHE
jgi:transposase